MGLYLEDHGDRLVVRPSPNDRLASGAFLAFVAAPLVLVAATTGAWIFAEDGLSFVIGWSFGALFGGVLAIAGLARMLGARRRAADRTVSIDLSERLLVRHGKAPEVLRGVDAVVVRKAPFAFRLELLHDDDRRTELLVVPRRRGRALSETATHLADVLGVRADVPRAASTARAWTLDRPKLAALCYAPIDGVFVAASLWCLMTSNDPFLRFCAKQSLLQLAVTGLCVVFLFGCCGVPFAAFASPAVSAGVMFVPLFALAVVRVIVRTIAALRAHRGEVWIIPWLAPLSRRWAPSQI